MVASRVATAEGLRPSLLLDMVVLQLRVDTVAVSNPPTRRGSSSPHKARTSTTTVSGADIRVRDAKPAPKLFE